MQRAHKWICMLSVSLIVFVGIFLWIAWALPVQLKLVDVELPMYDAVRLTADNVTGVTLFGRHVPVKGLMAAQQEDGSLSVTCDIRDLRYVAQLNVIPAVSHKVVYDKPVYVGQPLDKTALHAYAVYEDGTELLLPDVIVSDAFVPMATKLTIPVRTYFRTVSWEVVPEVPVAITAEYTKTDASIGDVFDKDNVRVTLHYSDDSTCEIADFTIKEPPLYLTEELSLSVVSDYGTTTLSFTPQNIQQLSAGYDGAVYEGDMLDTEKFQLSMLDEAGKSVAITDFTFDNPGRIKTHTQVLLESKYGSGVVDIHPIPVTSVTGKLEQDVTPGMSVSDVAVTELILTYEDGRILTLEPTAVVFTNLDSGVIEDTYDIWFVYHGMRYSFSVGAVSDTLRQFRSNPDLITSVVNYSMTDEQLQTVATLCQWIAGDNVLLAAAEASLLANRFALYSGDAPSTDGAHLVNYMQESGYWGMDVADYLASHTAEDATLQLVRDVLVHGHRLLPAYVDERAVAADIALSLDADLVREDTMITKSDGVEFVFYTQPSADDMVLYGYTTAARNLVSE